VVPRTVLPATCMWEHEGTSAAKAATTSGGTIGDGPTVVAEDDMVVPLAVCRQGGTSVEHP
jgi:hypothetical protein